MDPENNSVTQPNFHVSKEDHPFCFLPRQHPTFTPRISLAENHYQCLKHQRDQTNNKLQQKKTDRVIVSSELKRVAGINCRSSLNDVTNWAIRRKKGFQCLLGEISGLENPRRLKDAETYSSVNELDGFIRKLHSKLQHGSNKRAEEKNLFEEIKNAELRRQNLIAAANKTPQASSREERIQNIVQNIEQLKTEDMAFRTKVQQHRRHLVAIEKDIRRLEKKLADLNVKKAQAFHRILQLKQYQFQSSVIFS
nr:Proton pump-interactor 1 [Ipomoea batatas]